MALTARQLQLQVQSSSPAGTTTAVALLSWHHYKVSGCRAGHVRPCMLQASPPAEMLVLCCGHQAAFNQLLHAPTLKLLQHPLHGSAASRTSHLDIEHDLRHCGVCCCNKGEGKKTVSRGGLHCAALEVLQSHQILEHHVSNLV